MTGSTVADFFLALSLVLGAAHVFGGLARRVGQPAVVGEICAGLLASPMVITTANAEAVLPVEVKPLLGALANVGLATFMFLIGYELDGGFLRDRRGAALGVAAGSVVVPMAAGVALAVPLAAMYAPGHHTAFVLFVGVAMSVTAFPVLARILADCGLNRHSVGSLALASAAIGDLVAWIGLAGVVAYASAFGQWQMALLPVYLVLMIAVVRPVLGAVVRRVQDRDRPVERLIPLLVAGLMLSCAATEWLGIHFIFGAFAFGAVMPRNVLGTLRTQIMRQMEQVGHILLPLYFVVAGVKVDLSTFTPATVLTLIAVIGVAVLSKAGGAYVGARLSGLAHSVAMPIAVLMNTRGLTEIVILAVALEKGLIDQSFYSMMVVMAVVTTAMTGPLLRLLGVHLRPTMGSRPAPCLELG
ncbi:cation:proton antiporter [Streptomyces sp. NBC_00201]|uniref:cation:proton antiporter n=1 Tax=unclassified Streptomyces TaxID=2593676 RepID=UPI002258BF58|nr:MULTISPECIES: cation:proton antiporter [unclassified Streptomyces]MCX5063740.1 cation:proton antiporter [Streptomyces sp. NBC_00452]MCX5251895.1 cation:proton antiporter [Streptomyces sp. NBC_00201]MCX5294202.1 cation:proton antiporter [Streptomyces sp. NBC_00183]